MTSFFIALQFLTRLKIVEQKEWTMEDFGRSVVAFPFVGFIIGLFLAVLYMILAPVLPSEPLMLILVIGEFLFTGGLHADGLMDTSDGLFSGRDRERKLEIMKDSRVGSFGVVAFVFVTLLKWQLLTAIPVSEYIPVVLFMMPLMSRFTLTLSICSYPYARESGMGKAFAQWAPKHSVMINTISTLLMPLIVAAICCVVYSVIFWILYSVTDIAVPYVFGAYLIVYSLIIVMIWNLFSMLVSYVINRMVNGYIVKQLGGTTGDTYGFVIEVTEVLLLFIYCIVLHLLFF